MYYYKRIAAQRRALKFAQDSSLIKEGYEPKFSSMGRGIILWSIDQGADTLAAAYEIAREYDLIEFETPYVPIRQNGCLPGARAMHDVQAQKVMGDFVIRLIGDDRGWGEGAYWLSIHYNNQEADRVLGLEGCGVS